MDLRQRRPFYDHKSSFWPLAEIIVLMMVIVASIFIADRRDYCYERGAAVRRSSWRSSHWVRTIRDMSALCVIFLKTSAGIFYLVVRRRMLKYYITVDWLLKKTY